MVQHRRAGALGVHVRNRLDDEFVLGELLGDPALDT
jgi:hypothetical protein